MPCRAVNDALIRQRRALRRNFNRAAATFDGAAIIHGELRQRLLERIAPLRPPQGGVRTLVDLGAATGHLARELQILFPGSRVLAIDLAESMLRAHARSAWSKLLRKKAPEPLVADARALPLRDASVDWVVSNALLPWCMPPEDLFAEVRRVLTPGGAFVFTTFGPDTLRELRLAGGALPHPPAMIDLPDMHHIGDALLRAGFGDPVLDVERFTLTYPDAASLWSDLRATGSAYAPPTHPGLSGRSRRAALVQGYRAFESDGRLPATVEAIFGLAWRAETSRDSIQNQTQNETRISLAKLRSDLSRRRQ